MMEMFGNSSSCSFYAGCKSCLADSACIWCTTDNKCIPTGSSQTCSSELMGSCDQSYFTIIFIIVLAATLCLCCTACYVRRYRRGDNHMLQHLLSPLLPNRAREYLFRNSLDDVGEDEWMCIICGFDNKPRNTSCLMCGTSHEFSSGYKDNKKLQRQQQRKNKNNRNNNNNKNKNRLGEIIEDPEENENLINNNHDIILNIEDGEASPRSRQISKTATEHEQDKKAINSSGLVTPHKGDQITIQDPDISSLSLSLKYFNAQTDKFVYSGAPLTAGKFFS
jgi:hypothetical protein